MRWQDDHSRQFGSLAAPMAEAVGGTPTRVTRERIFHYNITANLNSCNCHSSHYSHVLHAQHFFTSFFKVGIEESYADY